jgi:RNA ligase (TIGR02306 family)
VSTFRVPVVKIAKVGKHPNADSLSITQVEGCPCIFRTGDFQPGDYAIYVPVEAVVPVDSPTFAFLGDPERPSKKTVRVKAKKLRGIFSMGILIKVPDGVNPSVQLGQDMAQLLGVKKYVEPESALKIVVGQNEKDPGFMPVYGVEHYRKYQKVLEPGEEITITEKLHGCNGRWTYRDGRLWTGSHNCIKKLDPERPCLWWRVALDYKLEEKLKDYPGLVIYGEVYGQVQDLKYGTKPGEVRLAVFDVYDAAQGRFLNWEYAAALCTKLGLPMVPVLYVGPYSDETTKSFVDGKSTIADNIREGVVIKPTTDRWDPRCGRVVLKLVSEAYLLRKGGTEAQ